MNHEKLAKLGFRAALVLHWQDRPGTFKIAPLDEDIAVLSVRSVVYAWYDRHRDVVMNVGRTSKSLKVRFLHSAGYEHWLNGLRADRDRPIRHKWLDYINTSKSGLIEVHIRRCDSSVLRDEETRFMNELEPRLNVRR